MKIKDKIVQHENGAQQNVMKKGGGDLGAVLEGRNYYFKEKTGGWWVWC